MLVLISEVISNSNAVIRQDFRKLRFQMIDDSYSSRRTCLSALHVSQLGPESRTSLHFSGPRMKFPTYLSSLVLLVHLSALVVHRALIVGICFRRAARLPLPPKKQARPNR